MLVFSVKEHQISKGQLSDRLFRDINTLLSLLFPSKFSRSGMPKTENDKNFLSKFPTAMERLGVSYFPFYPLQMIFHLYMYEQFYMLKPLRPLEVLLYRTLPQF